MSIKLSACANSLSDKGRLQINVLSGQNNHPISDATVTISYAGESEDIIEKISTNLSGQTEQIQLDTPPHEMSQTPDAKKPHGEYTIKITAPGYKSLVIDKTEVLCNTTALQDAILLPSDGPNQSNSVMDTVTIPAHTLSGKYPPKIAEAEIKPLEEIGQTAHSKIVIPETVIVHDGVPTDHTAKNYYVSYRDYIKNVASGEIYATWPESTIIANILAIMSFTLNRVYTKWYSNKGLDFTVTSSTAYDHKWVNGRNTFHNISLIVDQIFNNYLSRPEVTQPILTQFCDGCKTVCPNWMSLWDSRDLGEQGHTPDEILKHYYGDTMYINSASQISGIPASWPGCILTIGEGSPKVMQIQEQLAAIAAVYTAIPKVDPDGIYNQSTAAAVKEFQNTFSLPITDFIDFRTWHKISHIYAGITRTV